MRFLPPFVASLATHFFVFAIVSFGIFQKGTTVDQEIVVDIVSESPVVGPTKNEKQKFQKTEKTEKSDVLDLPQQNQEIVNGESEIGSDLVGRRPRDAQEKYLVGLRNQVRLQQKYPKQSLVFKEEGLVKVRMTLDRNGALTKMELIQGSPFPRLNDAAMKAVSDAAPFPEFPTEIEFQTWKVTVPIQFMFSRN